jgi:hypothetical protein
LFSRLRAAVLSTPSTDRKEEDLGDTVLTPTTTSNPDIPKEDVSSDPGENPEDAAL